MAANETGNHQSNTDIAEDMEIICIDSKSEESESNKTVSPKKKRRKRLNLRRKAKAAREWGRMKYANKQGRVYDESAYVRPKPKPKEPKVKMPNTNPLRGKILLVCDEEVLSPAQKRVFDKHDEEMRAYKAALEAYNRSYPAQESTDATAQSNSTTVMATTPTALQNGVLTRQRQQQPLVTRSQPLPKPQVQKAFINNPTPVKKILAPSTWQPPVQPQIVNTVTVPMASNVVATQQVIPKIINPVNPAPRTVIQLPVGTNLSGMQVVNVPHSTGSYQLVVTPQVSYPGIGSSVVTATSVLPKPAVPVANSVVPVSSNKIISVVSAKQISTPTSGQAGNVPKTTPLTIYTSASSSAVSGKRPGPTAPDSANNKRAKTSSDSAPDVEDNYYGWKQGRLWWDDEKPKGNFRCFVCNKKLPTNIRYMQHVKHHLDKEQQQNSSLNDIISCRSCYKHFNTPSALQRHIEKAHTYSEHRCGICEISCNDGPALLEHLSTTHKTLQMPYVCGVCNYATSIYDDLIAHFNKHHEGSKSLMCPFCVRIIRCNNAFLRHCKTHLTVSIRNGLFRCRSCKLMFLNNNMLKEHMQEDHKSYNLQDRSGIPNLPTATKDKPAKTAHIQKVTFPKQALIKISPSLWSRREILKPRGHLRCIECGTLTEASQEHFRKKWSCNRCKYTTYCGSGFANHMILFHKTGSAPKVHHIRKTAVNDGRILLGCRNCEFSTLSPTLMACHIESCPRGAMTIESFKVRTNNLLTSRHYKREVMPVKVKPIKEDEIAAQGDDDDVIVIEDEVVVDLTDETTNKDDKTTTTSAEDKENKAEETKIMESNVSEDETSEVKITAPTKKEEASQSKTQVKSSLSIKLEKLPNDITLPKLADQSSATTGKNPEENTKETSPDEPMEIAAPSNAEKPNNTSDNGVANASENSQDQPDTVGEEVQAANGTDVDNKSSENGVSSSNSSDVARTKELQIKLEQISTSL